MSLNQSMYAFFEKNNESHDFRTEILSAVSIVNINKYNNLIS